MNLLSILWIVIAILVILAGIAIKIIYDFIDEW
jgi:Tfp pilus assembly major pilin PilA